MTEAMSTIVHWIPPSIHNQVLQLLDENSVGQKPNPARRSVAEDMIGRTDRIPSQVAPQGSDWANVLIRMDDKGQHEHPLAKLDSLRMFYH